MPEIRTTDGQIVLIDEVDLPVVAGRKIGLCHGYPRIRYGHSRISLHRVIMGARPRQLVDHINRNPLDNRRMNLRFCDRRENGRNRSGLASHNTSGFRGVTRHRKAWHAQINLGDRNLYLGSFKDKRKAAKVYDEAALRYFGAFAGKLNFPQD